MSATAATALIEDWQGCWPQALACWSQYTQLQLPLWLESARAARAEGLTGSFAAIRFADQRVLIDTTRVIDCGLQTFGLQILAHEIGHHVLAPGNLADQVRLMARINRGLQHLPQHAALVGNLYTDLLINDRLQRHAGLDMAAVYRQLLKDKTGGNRSRVWALYMGIYEQLWRLPAGSLLPPGSQLAPEADGWLGAQTIRVYARDWLTGAGRFAALLLPYLVEDDEAAAAASALWLDTESAGKGCEPVGGLEIDEQEDDADLHPAYDPAITCDEPAGDAAGATQADARSKGQLREPFELGALLKAAGLDLSDHELAVRYYRQRALPHLVALPTQVAPKAQEPELEGFEPWPLGAPLDEIDWQASVCVSPQVVPGFTTLRRVYSSEPGHTRARLPLDLDLYVDSSGSMPNPQQNLSWLTLAGAIIALSALRAGASVQVTLWSGVDQYLHTNGFVRDETRILQTLTGYFGGSTAFPIHRLRETYAQPRPRATHILHISDEGLTTAFDPDEKGRSGWDIAHQATAAAGGGATMALNLPAWMVQSLRQPLATDTPKDCVDLRRAEQQLGWRLHAISDWESLGLFARAFSKQHYGPRHAA